MLLTSIFQITGNKSQNNQVEKQDIFGSADSAGSTSNADRASRSNENLSNIGK